MENNLHPNDDGRELIDGGTGQPFNEGQRYSHFLWLENGHQSLRRQEYPPIGDQLDALFKAGLFPPEMAAKIQAVKDKYPKSTEGS